MVRIVVGYEGSEQSHDAVALATMLAESTGAELVLAMAFPHLEPSPDFEHYSRELAQESDPLVAEASPLLREGGREFRTRAMGGVPAAQALADVARSENANLLVVGSTHRGAIGRILPGSVGERLLRDSPTPVAIAPRGYAEAGGHPLRVVGAAFDATEEAHRAVRVACELAMSTSAALRLFAVVEDVKLGDVVYRSGTEVPEARFSRAALDRELDRLIEGLPSEVGAQKVVVEGDPAETLPRQERAVDLMTIGSHGRGALLGSVSTKVARSAPWPLVVVPPTVQAAQG